MGARRGGPGGVGARRSGAPEGWGPKGRGPKGGGPKGGGRRVGAQNFALFFLFPAGNLILSSLSKGGFLVEFWWCLKHRDAQICAFGVLWLSCEAPAARSGGAAGVSHDSPKAHTKIQRENHQREKKE